MEKVILSHFGEKREFRKFFSILELIFESFFFVKSSVESSTINFFDDLSYNDEIHVSLMGIRLNGKYEGLIFTNDFLHRYIESKIFYQKNRIHGFYISRDISGKINFRGYFFEGKSHGLMVSSYEEIHTRYEYYQKGSRHNLQLFTDEKTISLWKISYNYGSKEGADFFYEKGKLHEVRFYSKNKRDGYSCTFYANSTLKSEGLYKNGKKEGPWIEYNRKEKKFVKKIYVKGIQVKELRLERKGARKIT